MNRGSSSPSTDKDVESIAFYQDMAVVQSFDGATSSMVRSAPRLSNSLLTSYSQIPGLPVPDVRCAARSEDGSLWLGTAHGVCRLKEGLWRYYAGRRWLPDDFVLSVDAVSRDKVLVTTANGAAKIEAVPITLGRKAAHYESVTAARHNRRGFVASCALTTPGDLDSFLFEATDNDGLWTALYVAAECFRYAVTRSPEARALARAGIDALISLVRVTEIPGFPARAIIRRGEPVLQSDPGPNWYSAPSDPDLLYKNDTSSDEIDGHYLAWFLYSELVADAGEKREIAAVCRTVTDHIIDHGYTLVGPTGRHTRWGVWSPERLNTDPEWQAERGLNSLAILSHLKVAAHLCGEPRFEAAYRSLIESHGYAENTREQKLFPPNGEDNHSDDELAACAYYPLLQLERDPALKAIYRESLERTHAHLRPQGSPFHNAIYAAGTGGDYDRNVCLAWFCNAPWDVRDWRMSNSHRADAQIAPRPDRFGNAQITRVLPAGERRVTKWNSNPYVADAGGEGESEEDGAFWLLPYWMSRHHGLL